MIPSTRKEMETFVAENSAGQISVLWLEPGELAYFPTADGKIFLEERDVIFEHANVEADLKTFFAGLVNEGATHLALRGQGVKRVVAFSSGGMFKPPVYHLAFATR